MAEGKTCALRSALAGCLGTLVITGCGGGGSGGGQDIVEEPASQLVVEVDFPLPHSSLRGATQVAVSGSVRDELDGTLVSGEIAAFAVNGINPSVDLATGRWAGVIPVAAGGSPFQITAEVTDRNGIVSTTSVTVESQPELPYYSYLSLLPGGDSAIVWGSGVLRRVDLTTGEEQPVTDGPAYSQAANEAARKGIQVGEHGQQVHVLDDCYIRECDTVLVNAVAVQIEEGAVLDTGHLSDWNPLGGSAVTEYRYFDVRDGLLAYSGRTMTFADGFPTYCGLAFLDVATGSSTQLLESPIVDDRFQPNFCPGALTVDTRRNRVIAAYDDEYRDAVMPGLYAIDLVTGAVSVASGNGAGEGPALDTPTYLFATSSGESVVTLGEQGIFSVALDSGDRRLLLAAPELPADVTDADFDETHNRIVIASGGDTISALNLASGSFETLLGFSNAVGAGPDLMANSPGVLDALHNRLLVLDTGTDTLLEIDLFTLQRRALVNGLHNIAVWSSVALNDEGTQLYYQDFSGDLYAIDLVTGEQRLLTGDTSGPDLGRARGMCFDSAQDLLYVVGDYTPSHPPFEPVFSSNGVLSIDSVTGAVSIVSGEEMAQDAFDVQLDAILCDPSRERLLIASKYATILEVDPSTGLRHRLFEPSDDGGGVYPRGFAWDTGNNRVLMHVFVRNDAGEEEVRSINLETGEYDIAARFTVPVTWVYDPSADIFYASRRIDDERGELFAMDRRSGSKAVIAHPR